MATSLCGGSATCAKLWRKARKAWTEAGRSNQPAQWPPCLKRRTTDEAKKLEMTVAEPHGMAFQARRHRHRTVTQLVGSRVTVVERQRHVPYTATYLNGPGRLKTSCLTLFPWRGDRSGSGCRFSEQA